MIHLCQCGWKVISKVDFDLTCPRCQASLAIRGGVMHSHNGDPSVPKIKDLKEQIAERGRACWAELHGCQEPTQQWYAEWLKTVPSFGCSCRKNWDELTTKYPPDFSSREAFFKWSVDRHNDVNRKLGKPQVSVMEAEGLHKAPPANVGWAPTHNQP
jgi:hypothetical protein